ncbi:MAG: 50S ribosomal protein L11 methyltransferase [Pseudomonadota bacterium]
MASEQQEWLQLTMVVDADAVDQISDLFEGFLAHAVTTENAGKDEFYEVAFPGKPDWQKVSVTALFDGNVDVEEIESFAQHTLKQRGYEDIPSEITRLKDQAWERVWLSSFKPLKISDDLWIVPSWLEPEDPQARNLTIDPGLAFGTGTHATTLLCLEWIAKQSLASKTVMDYGAGSGILALATLLSGADIAHAVDIDPLAVTASQENAERNREAIQEIDDRFTSFLTSEAPAPQQQYQLVIGNILAEVILELQETFCNYVEPGGTILLTGILSNQAAQVSTAFSEQFDFQEFHKDHWVLLIGTKTN